MAGTAGIADSLTLPMAGRAGLLHGEYALLHPHLTNAATGGTGLLLAIARTTSLTGLAGSKSGHLYLTGYS
jgi:hypothetical protein